MIQRGITSTQQKNVFCCACARDSNGLRSDWRRLITHIFNRQREAPHGGPTLLALNAVTDHPKFSAFKEDICAPRGATLGWLVSIWQFTSNFTPQGNIGKYSDEKIEAWVGWRGDAGDLIFALIKNGWLDRDPQHRLLVHDWHVHADDATRRVVMSSGRPFFFPGLSTS